MDQHQWLISEDWVKQKAVEAKNKTIFLCGGSSDMSKILPLFDKIIWLKTDEHTIRERVKKPRDHTYGTRPHELVKAIKENLVHEQEYSDLGATIVDARNSLEQVVNEVIKSVGV